MNKQCDSNILTVFRNGVAYCNIVPITVTLIIIEF